MSGRNYPLFILNGMQTNTTDIGPHQNQISKLVVRSYTGGVSLQTI